jgi:hypothetical protein
MGTSIILQDIYPLTSLVRSYSDVACEPTRLLPGRPCFLRPADVGILLVAGSTALPVTHLLLPLVPPRPAASST